MIKYYGDNVWRRPENQQPIQQHKRSFTLKKMKSKHDVIQ